ncbi:MAG: dienelactone hydrolase family protein [Phycisphaerae bacterium]|nr:dienelactone hydrolase family protein [Phycisphaerae bacterium]
MLSFGLTLSSEPPPPKPETGRIATGFLYKTLTLDDETYAYCVYVPPNYTPEQAWPVILFLHGSGERGRDGFLQTEVGLGTAIRKHHHLIPALVVMPQCRPRQSWIGPRGLGPMGRMALKCVEETSRRYHCDPDRIYLTGLSLGGHGAWALAAGLPGRFAAVVPICGFAELGDSTGLAEKLAPRLADVPIWCFHGDTDPNVPVTKTRQMVVAIRKAGGQVEYTEYKGMRHNVWDRTYADPALWKWLFAQKRPAAGTGTDEQ